MESHNKAAKVISRVLSLPACSGTVKFMTHLQVFLLLLPVFRRVKGIKTVYVCVWVFMCMSLVCFCLWLSAWLVPNSALPSH